MKPDRIGLDLLDERHDTAPCCTRCGLSELPAGCLGRVVSFSCAQPLRRRLMALGVCPSAEVCVLGRAPAGGPLVVRAGTVRLMLREHEAASVEVDPVDVEQSQAGSVAGVAVG
jgi:ferrous iron transport protein A